MNSVYQAKAYNIGMNLKDLALLCYIKDNFFLNKIIGAEVKNANPLIFGSSSLKESYINLTTLDFFEAEYLNGNITIRAFNTDKMQRFFKIETVVVKKEKTKIAKKEEDDDDMKRIKAFYKTQMNLNPRGLDSVRNRNALITTLSAYSIEELEDALKYANDSKWVENAYDETWMNAWWIFKKISDFMEGGRYRNKSKVSKSDIPKQVGKIYL